VALCVLAYFGIIKALQAWVRQRGKPFDLNWVRLRGQRQTEKQLPRRSLSSRCAALQVLNFPFSCLLHLFVAAVDALFVCLSSLQFVILHNSLMSIGSAVLWLAMVAELLLIYWGHDLWSLACDPRGLHTSGPIYFIYYVNYIFKVRREQKQKTAPSARRAA
jgi:hypothetical protein